MSANYTIRHMKTNEVPLAIAWAKEQGWNPGINDAQSFYEADHNGFFIGLLDDEPIAVGSAVCYGNDFAFCGLYIVKSEYRGSGYGLRLTQERLKYTGDRLTGLDGVLDKVDKYKRLGYVEAHKNIRYAYTGPHTFSPSAQIVDVRTLPFKDLESFDRKYFPGPRQAFLQSWISQPESLAYSYMEGGSLKGYGVVRKCFNGYKIGPLFAENAMIAHSLFEALVAGVSEGLVFLDCPEPNLEALKLVQIYQMEPQFQTIRMYRNGSPDLPLNQIFGITTFELG